MKNHEETKKKKKEKKSRPVLMGVLLGIVALIVLLGIGAFVGVKSGQSVRFAKETQDSAVEAYIQFEAAMSDLEHGNCQIAQTRLEFVVKANPSYPGLTEALTQAILCSNATATIIPIIEPTITPTPDNRNIDVIFSEAEMLYASKDWVNLIYLLDALRNNHPLENPIRIDQMYYTAYRELGMRVLLKQGDLEGGIYYFTSAEKYGPLDAEAQNYSQWASWYLTGVSYWEVNWTEVMNYMQQVNYAAPHLWDGQYTAAERVAEAGQFYGQEQIEKGVFYLEVNGWCASNTAFQEARNYVTFSVEESEKATKASEKCAEDPTSKPLLEWIK